VALAFNVVARSLAETGRADYEDLEAIWPGLVASTRAGYDAHCVPFLELDDLVVDRPTGAHSAAITSRISLLQSRIARPAERS
jgi:hypothetical protein